MASTEEALNNQYSSTMNEDSVNPFFHSSSDNNIVQLVFEKLIGGKNYFPWARSMIISLTAKHKIGFIDGLCSTGAFWDSGAGAGAGAGLGNF